MTPAQARANGLGNPSLPQLWLTAMLRVFAELVLHVVSTFQMSWLRPKRDWHTPDDETPLPRVTTDTHIKEHHAVQQDSPIALMLRDREAIVSKHEGVLTIVSHTRDGSVNSVHASPAKAGVQPPSDKSARLVCRSSHSAGRSAQTPFAPSLDPGLRRGCVSKDRAT